MTRPIVWIGWVSVGLLVALGFYSSVVRAIGVIESVYFTDGPVPALTRFDQQSTAMLAAIAGLDQPSDLLREVQRQNVEFLGKFNKHPVTTLLHVMPGALLIVLAPLQFSRRLRATRLWWHRWSGRVVIALAIPITMSGLYFGLLMPFSGPLEASAVAVFGSLFFYSVIRGYAAIRRKAIAEHREWMIRMFAVAVGISTVRVAGTVFALTTHAGPAAWFGYSVWIGWVVTVVIAEAWIVYTRQRHGATYAVFTTV